MPGNATFENIETPEIRRKKLEQFEQSFSLELKESEQLIGRYQQGIEREKNAITINLVLLNNTHMDKKFLMKEDQLHVIQLSSEEIIAKKAEIDAQKSKSKEPEKKYITNIEEIRKKIDESVTRIKDYSGYIIELNSRIKIAHQGLDRVAYELQELQNAAIFSVLKSVFCK